MAGLLGLFGSHAATKNANKRPNVVGGLLANLPRNALASIERGPTSSELDYFKNNLGVGGMASEDDRIVMNPMSRLAPQEQDAVRLNELSRLYMRQFGAPSFGLTDEQANALKGTHYANAGPQDRASTIAARILSGDPSAGKPTEDQSQYVRLLREGIVNYLGARRR